MRRLALASIALPLVWALASTAYLAWLHQQGQLPPLDTLTFGDLWMNWLKWPTLLFAGAFLVGCAHIVDARRSAHENTQRLAAAAQAEQDSEAKAKEAALARQRFGAQVVGIQWLDPLQRRDYPTEWQLLWTMGLVKPNADDDMVPKNPDKWLRVQSISGLAFNLFGKATLKGFAHSYIKEIFLKLREPYLMDAHYFYSVARDLKPGKKRELAGMRIELALPPALDASESVAFVRKEFSSSFSLHNPRIVSSSEPPDVRLNQGGASIGFTSLDAALDYLEDHPDKTVWVMSFDAPSFPKDEQMNETATLLVLAAPGFNTGREPLAWLHRPSRASASNGAAAWRAALDEAAARGALTPNDVGYLIHDAGQGSDASSRRIGALAQAATELRPDHPFLDTSFNTTALLGDTGAGTALTNIALAIAYAHHKNTPVIVAGTHDSVTSPGTPAGATAVLVRPPANPSPFDPNKNWFRARGEGYAYLPWWARRHDAKNPQQGWSD